VEITLDAVRRWAPVLVITACSLGASGLAAHWTAARLGVRARTSLWTGLAAAWLWLLAGAAMASERLARQLPPWGSGWVVAGALLLALASLAWFGHAWCERGIEFRPERRRMLRTAQAALVSAPALAAGYGMLVGRSAIEAREIDLPVPGLPRDLHGLRIAQITDIHLGTFFSRAELERAVAMANEHRAHLAVVTGDLITRSGDPLLDCLDALRGLKASAGILGCLGNHEVYAGVEDLTAREAARRGIRFLREEAVPLRFGQATLNVAGVDYQRLALPFLENTAPLVRPDAVNLLLSHNPAVFEVAEAQGFAVTLSGHTHGGQINVEILNSNVNLARFFTPYVYGAYRKGQASIYVSAGLGAVGVPMRLGAPPEVTLIRLCAA
jgi:predicted MPP superfamily phosphohydrolase